MQPAPEANPVKRDIVLLTALDGIGAAPCLIEQRFGQPRLALVWEIDQDCLKVTAAKLPWFAHKGDITKDDPKKVAATSETRTQTKSASCCSGRFRRARTSPRLGPGRATKAQGDASSPSPPSSRRRSLTTCRAIQHRLHLQERPHELGRREDGDREARMSAGVRLRGRLWMGHSPTALVAVGQMGRPHLGPVRRLCLGLGKKGWLPPPTAQYAPEGGHRLLHGRLQLSC